MHIGKLLLKAGLVGLNSNSKSVLLKDKQHKIPNKPHQFQAFEA
jgi:hypothetical protein